MSGWKWWLSAVGVLLAACSQGSGAVDDLGTGDLGGPDLAAPPDAGRPDRAPPDSGPDQFVPFALELTVDDIPLAMNGSQPFTNLAGQPESFRLTLPRSGFTVDLSYRGSLAQPATLQLTCDVDLGSGAALVKAGSDLSPRLKGSGGELSLLLPPDLALPVGDATFSAKMSDGTQTLTGSLTVSVQDKTFLLDPFRLEDRWLLLFSQDLYTIKRITGAGGGPQVSSTPTPNGVPDFDEDLRVLGFGTTSPLPAAAATKNLGVTGTNAIVRAWVQQELLAALRQIYHLQPDGSQGPDSVNIRFFLEGQSGAPQPSDYQHQVLTGGEAEKAFSVIAIGGGDLTRGYIGYSKTVDLRNLENEDNLGPDFGVFTTSALAMVLQLLDSDPTVKLLLGKFLEPFLPELGQGGKPVGEHALDATILAAGFDPATADPAAQDRYDKLGFLVQTLGRLTGTLVAHEIGHGLGLVASGPPPHGLFGGEKNASFVNGARTTKVHIDTPGFNVMQAGPGTAPGATLNVAELLTTPSFNELNLAYLRGRLLLLPQP